MATALKKPDIDSPTMLHVRVSDDLKSKAAETLGAIGLTTSEAVRLFLHRVVVEQRLPLDLKVPNAATRAAMEEGRTLKGKRFKSPESMFDALEKTG